ncbi:HdeD family acid-resistance protein [Ancylobacter moscoviensis]
MIRLAFLLLGGDALRPQWRVLAMAGAGTCLLGLLMLADLSDGKLSVVTDTLGILLALHGLVELAAAMLLGVRTHLRAVARGLAFLIAGFLVADIPWDNNIGSATLFGAAFAIDGVLRIASAAVVRNPRWRQGLAAGLVEIVLAVVILAGHPLPHRLTVPFCLALLLLSSGYTLFQLAMQLRALGPGRSVTSLPFYASRNWHGGGGHGYENRGAGAEFPGQTLMLHVWTATGSADGGHGPIVVRRYVAAVDRHGVVSTGHAALELPPDLYVSHYPAVEIDRDSDDFRHLLDSRTQNDVAGRFQPSYAEEVAGWCPADQTVTFTRFNPAALRAFWREYSQDTTYNLTARNCSSSSILALDAAMEGVLRDGKPLRRLLKLLVDPHFWLLRLVRGRAELMTWTPGLALDYARFLHEVTERGDRRWRQRLQDAWRERHIAVRARIGERA